VSPTLDLVSDCLRFVIAFSEVINASAPHIYHTALHLSPQASMVHKLYELHARPFARVVQGSPISWKLAVAIQYHQGGAIRSAWSPCGRFFAVARLHCKETEVLDAVTLERLHTFESPPDKTSWLSFSPDSRLLTRFSDNLELTSWDLQTGGPVNTIPSELGMPPMLCPSSTYSMDGKMVAIGYWDDIHIISVIPTYDLPRTHTCYHHSPEGFMVVMIWTHGECIRFAAAKPGSIAIWEIGFASTDTPTEVERLPAPRDIDCSRDTLFLPTLYRLANGPRNRVLVWDARDSKLLLDFVGNIHPMGMSFSPDGRFLVYGTASRDIYIWEESHTGYVLQKLISIYGSTRPFFSPDGESIIMVHHSNIQLLRTADLIPSPSATQARSVGWGDFILEFSPDETLAAIGRVHDNTATVLDLKSGHPRLIVDAGMEILGLRVTENTIIVVGEGRVVTWNLPAGSHTFSARMNIVESVQATKFNYSESDGCSRSASPYTSISPDCNHVIITRGRSLDGLALYDVSSGERLTGAATLGSMPWFSPDGREVWCMDNHAEGWTIVKDSESGVTKLEPLGPTTYPSGGIPWRSSLGYKVTDDWWVVSPSGKRLLWLPHDWRSDEKYRRWSGRFLGLLHDELPEAVILELDE